MSPWRMERKEEGKGRREEGRKGGEGVMIAFGT